MGPEKNRIHKNKTHKTKTPTQWKNQEKGYVAANQKTMNGGCEEVQEVLAKMKLRQKAPQKKQKTSATQPQGAELHETFVLKRFADTDLRRWTAIEQESKDAKHRPNDSLQ